MWKHFAGFKDQTSGACGIWNSGSLAAFLVHIYDFIGKPLSGAQWLSGRVLDSRPKGRVFEPHRRQVLRCVLEQEFILA